MTPEQKSRLLLTTLELVELGSGGAAGQFLDLTAYAARAGVAAIVHRDG
jgi:hypothetical protein